VELLLDRHTDDVREERDEVVGGMAAHYDVVDLIRHRNPFAMRRALCD
jgi:hypothetical protein